ncbi:hypothetical protein [Cytobacillus horneckiae]|uniref:Uncharacterized protein n=1 Tax=Cytobacillus horneckiae TaxID=549687 RepID=A0A2N0ZAX8_9BACI|nr:hypothetical protein [Cytobacillus horneckiae]MEC1158730.1 hypothetical protein [Cytobacillus horneckiae]NRG47436.1 hypothetical protein [Bacillus sp. CRN 9]PKG26660.1 hypothetical protein CWS20_22700 [Cytobacillus horneckiae]
MLKDVIQVIISFFNNQNTVEILCLSSILYIIYLLIFIAYYRDLKTYHPWQMGYYVFEIPISLPIFIFSWLIYDKLPQGYTLFVETYNSIIIFLSIPLILIGIFNVVFLIVGCFCMLREEIYLYRKFKHIKD